MRLIGAFGVTLVTRIKPTQSVVCYSQMFVAYKKKIKFFRKLYFLNLFLEIICNTVTVGISEIEKTSFR